VLFGETATGTVAPAAGSVDVVYDVCAAWCGTHVVATCCFPIYQLLLFVCLCVVWGDGRGRGCVHMRSGVGRTALCRCKAVCMAVCIAWHPWLRVCVSWTQQVFTPGLLLLITQLCICCSTCTSSCSRTSVCASTVVYLGPNLHHVMHEWFCVVSSNPNRLLVSLRQGSRVLCPCECVHACPVRRTHIKPQHSMRLVMWPGQCGLVAVQVIRFNL
jgi:hypothetical protein